MLPLTPATSQRTGSRLQESKCSIGRLAARASIQLRNCGKCSFLVFIKIYDNTTIFKTSKLLCNVNGMLSASTNLRNSLPLGRTEWSIYQKTGRTQQRKQAPHTTTGSYKKRNHTVFVKRYLGIRQIHPTLGTTPPQVSQDEEKMPRSTRVELARLRSQRSLMLEEYKAKVENRAISPCIKCGKHEGDLCHLLRCFPTKPLQKSKLWKDPIGVARALGLATTQFDPGGAPS
uniref:Uncharacterized protein n=1 Tax=Caenorhabditis japonica TaxID=281687 RepID=A0A8R1ILE5_CAEJA